MNKWGFFLGMLVAVVLTAAAGFFLVGKESPEPGGLAPAAGNAEKSGPVDIDAPKTLEAATKAEARFEPLEHSVTPTPLPRPAPPEVPKAIYVTGSISLPPTLSNLAQGKELPVMLEASVANSTERDSIAGPAIVDASKGFPAKFRIPVKEAFLAQFADRRDVLLSVRAWACYDLKKGESCGALAPSRLFGWVRARLTLKKAGAEATLQLPAIVLNSLIKPMSDDKCRESANSLSGVVQATPAFLATPGRPKRFVMIGIPRTSVWIGSRIIGSRIVGGAPGQTLTAQELGSLEELGIAHQMISMADANPVPFSLFIPPKLRQMHYHLYLNACREGQSDKDCLATAFPFAPEIVSGLDQAGGHFKLVPAGFEIPACGTKGQKFFLHHWSSNSWATDGTVRSANPPELIEGASF